jgi:hypothetical protein
MAVDTARKRRSMMQFGEFSVTHQLPLAEGAIDKQDRLLLLSLIELGVGATIYGDVTIASMGGRVFTVNMGGIVSSTPETLGGIVSVSTIGGVITVTSMNGRVQVHKC